ALAQPRDRRQHGGEPQVVLDVAVAQRHVAVDAHEHAGAVGDPEVLQAREVDGHPGGCASYSPTNATRSTTRFDYPHSLSYQPSTLPGCPCAFVSTAEETHDDGLPTMSAETSGSSVYSSTPRNDASAAALANASLISETDGSCAR